MVSVSALLLLAAPAFHGPTPLLRAPRAPFAARRTSALTLMSEEQLGPVAQAEQSAVDVEIELDDADKWAAKVASPEVQALRQKLIDQYIALNRSEEYAIKEVDEFLADPKRSQGWVKAQELQKLPGWGFGDPDSGNNNQVYFFAFCFVAGIALQAGAKYLGSLTGAMPSS